MYKCAVFVSLVICAIKNRPSKVGNEEKDKNYDNFCKFFKKINEYKIEHRYWVLHIYGFDGIIW